MSDKLFQHAVRDWLDDGSDLTPRRAIDAVLLAVKTTPQERDLRIPRRFTIMPTYLRLAAVAAIIAVAGVGLVAYLGSPPGPGATNPPATPTAIPAAIGPSASPPPSLDVPFKSTVFGYDAMYPHGWHAMPGTAQGSARDLALADPSPAPATFWDHFTARENGAGPALIATSAVLPTGMSEDDWVAAYQAPQVAQAGRACIPLRTAWEAVTIDGRAGGIYEGCGFVEALAFVEGRVYVMSYVDLGAPQASVATSGRRLLEAFLQTVKLHPDTAEPAPAAT